MDGMTDDALLRWAFSLAPKHDAAIHWVHGFLTGLVKSGNINLWQYNRVSNAVATVAIEH